jgi:hypothetical protein
LEITKNPQPVHKFLGTVAPDDRLKDVELIFRFFAFELYRDTYKGNLKRFLDDAMKNINKNWQNLESRIQNLYEAFNQTAEFVGQVFGDYKYVGRKFVKGDWEPKFNKALFEVEIFYFNKLRQYGVRVDIETNFLSDFKKLCEDNEAFRRSIETTTKSLENYKTRFELFEELINKNFSVRFNEDKFAPSTR